MYVYVWRNTHTHEPQKISDVLLCLSRSDWTWGLTGGEQELMIPTLPQCWGYRHTLYMYMQQTLILLTRTPDKSTHLTKS